MNTVSNKGFTLIELLIGLAIVGVASAAIIGLFISQNRSYVVQDETVTIQQNVRAGIDFLTREIRMAGYNPTGAETAGITFGFFPGGVGLGRSSVCFTLDITGGESDGIDNDDDGTVDGVDASGAFLESGDGDTADANEQITYSLNADGSLLRLSSATAVVPQPVADGIDRLAFAFAFDSDGNGRLDTAGGNIIYAIIGNNGTGTLGTDHWYDMNGNDTGIIARGADIRAVQFWILARAGHPDPAFTNNTTYQIGDQSYTPNDNIRRRLLVTSVRCRNLVTNTAL